MSQIETTNSSKPRAANRWWIPFGSAVALVVGNGPVTLLSFGVFIRPIEADVGWGRGHLSATVALAAFFSALCVPIAGALMDRRGVKRVLLPVICIYALNVAAIGLANSFPLFLALTALSGITGAAQGPIGYQKIIARFFDKHNGLATGIAMSGVGIGTALMPQYAQFLIAHLGWRQAYFGMAAAEAIIALPAVLLCLREPGEPGARRSGAALDLPGLTVPEVLRSRTFWLTVLVVLIVSMAVNGSVVHTVPFLLDRGYTPVRAASMMGAVGLSTIVGRLLTGYLLDRIFAPYVACAVFLIAAIGLGLMANDVAPTFGAVALGFATGTEVNVIGYMVSRYFGLKRFGQIYGYLFAALTIGSGVGPLAMGAVYSAAHSYAKAFLGFELALVIASILILFVGRYPTRLAEPI